MERDIRKLSEYIEKRVAAALKQKRPSRGSKQDAPVRKPANASRSASATK